jgi:hypothetical protein
MNNFTRKILLVWAGIGVAALCIVALSLVLGSVANAQGMPGGPGPSGMVINHGGTGGRMLPGVFGKVTAIDGTTLSVLGGGRPSTTQTTYTVNAANATVLKNATTSSVGAIAVGDSVMVQGTVSGATVTATRIFDGIPPMGRGNFMGGRPSGTWQGASGTRMRPSGTPPFASGTFPGWRGSSSTPSGTWPGPHFPSSTASGTPPQGNSHPGFFGSIGNFLGGLFRWRF